MKYTFSFITLSLLVIILAGCEKEKDYLAGAKAGSVNAVGFGVSNGNAIVLNVDATTTSIDTLLKVFFNNSQTYSSATNVTVTVDTAVLSAYNNANGSTFDTMPSGVYSIAPLSIPANAKEGNAKVSIDISSLLSYGTAFGLGLTITSVQGGPGSIHTENSQIVIIVRVKNAYDADYTVTGFFFHPSAPRSIALTKHLSTVGAKTSYAGLGDLGSAFLFDVDGSALTNWVPQGAPAASGFMTLDNPAGVDYSSSAPNNPGAGEWVSSKYNNTYSTEGTPTFWMHYGYKSGGAGQETYTRQVYEKWVRQ